MFHFAFFLKVYKEEVSKKEAQDIFDFVIRQIELSIREIGYGDVSVNKKMKDYINLLFSIIEIVDTWESLQNLKKTSSYNSTSNTNISLYTGTFDVIDKEGDDQTTLFGIEHRNPNLFRMDLKQFLVMK